MPLARLRESASTLLGLAAVAAIVTAVGAGSLAFLAHEGTEGVRAELATRVGADLALQASLSPVGNAEAQDAQVRAAIASSLGGTGIRFDVTRAMSGEVIVESESADEPVVPGVAMSFADLDERADLVAGAFAERETEVAVQADAARDLGLEVGDAVLLNGAKFTVTGTWRATDYLDPRWYGDPMIETGDDDAYGPFAIAERAWPRLDMAPRVTWTVVPTDLDGFTSTNIAEVITAWSRAQVDWRGQVDDLQGFSVQRGLSKTLAELETRLDGQRAIEPVVLTLIGALGLVAAFELVALLAGIRARESYLHWSRGRSPGRIALRTAADVAAAAAVGAVAGALLVVVGGLALGFGEALRSLAGPLAMLPVVAIALSAALAAATTLRSLRTLTHRSRGGRPDARTARRVAVPGAVVLVLAAAGIAVWQLRLYGSAVIVSQTGTTSVDPVAVAAPAAALVALVLLIAALLPWLARRGERAVRALSIPSTLAARSLALHSARFTAPLVVVALAVGGMTVSAAYSSTWATSYDAAAALRVGSDLHVSAVDRLDRQAQEEVRAAAGADAVAPWSRQALSLGSLSGSIVAVSPEALATLASSAGGLFDREAAADDIRIDPPGPVLPAGSSRATIAITTSGLQVAPVVSAHVVDPLGFASVVDFEPASGAVAAGKGSFAYSAELPSADQLTVLAVDFGFPNGSFSGATAVVRLGEMTAGGAPVDLGPFWIPGNPGVQGFPPGGDGTGLGLSIGDDSYWARLVPSLDGTLYERGHPPVVIAQRVADLLGVGVGDTLSFSLEDGVERLNWDVAAVVPVIPGAPTETAVMVDLAVVQHYELRATEVPPEPRDLWLRTDSPDDLRGVIRPLLPASARIDTVDDPAALAVLGSPRLALWAAAVASVLLALIAVLSSVRARIGWGRNDVAALRALGLGPRAQRGVPVREFTAVLVLGLLWGLLAGAAVAALTVPQIARAAVPQRYQAIGTSASWDLPALALLVGALLLGLVVVVVGLSRATARLAQTAIPQGGAG